MEKLDQMLMSNVVKNDQIDALNQRTDRLNDLLGGLQKLLELQNIINLAVTEADQVLYEVEDDIDQINEQVVEGNKELVAARFYQKKRYRMCMIVGGIVLVILIGVGIYLAIKYA